MNSNDISQMFGSQNSMFAGQNAYAQQIGVAPPVFGQSGLNAWGGGGMGGGHGSPYSYSPSAAMGGGYGGGNKFAGIGMSAFGGAASFGAGMALDPFGAFLGGAAGGLARGGLGAALGGGMAASLPVMPLAFAAQAGIGAFMRGGQQQSAMNTTLGQNFNFFNPNSRTGSGFTRDDAKSIGDSVRGLAHIPEMMSSVEELTRLMPKLKASGVMQGVKSASEFQSRFKEAVSTIRDMSKILGSTMEEAEQFFAHSRSVGFTGRSSQLRNTLNAQLTSGMTGMSNGQVMQLQQAGANMATQVGARRSLGATAVTNMAQTLGAAQRDGRIKEGMLEDMTGLQGGDAVQATAQRMTEAMYNFSQRSPVGQAMMLGLTKFDKDGKAIGLDQARVRGLQNGTLDINDLKRFGSSLTNSQKISFTHRKAGTLAMELAGQVGAGGAFDIFNKMLGGKGTDATQMIMGRHTGLNEQEMDVAASLSGAGMGDQENMQQMAKLRQQEAKFRERTDPSTILRRLKTRLHASTLGGFEQAGAKIFTELGKVYDSFVDDVVGRHVVTLSKEGADGLARAMSGGSKKDLTDMFEAASGLKKASGNSKFNISDSMRSMLDPLGLMNDGSAMKAFIQKEDFSNGMDALGGAVFENQMVGGERNANYLNTGLAKGLTAEGAAAMGDAKSVMRGIQGGIEHFDEMDNKTKLEALREGIKQKIAPSVGYVNSDEDLDMILAKGDGNYSDDTKKLLKAMKASRGAGAKDYLSGVVSGTQGEFDPSDTTQVDFGDVGGADLGKYYGTKQAERLSKDALAGLQSAGLKDTTISLVTSNPEARKLLADARTDEKVRSAMNRGDTSALEAMGYRVKESDLKTLKEGLRDIDNVGSANGKALADAFSNYDKAEKVGNGSVVLNAFHEKAGDISRSARELKKSGFKGAGLASLEKVASAMQKFSSGEGSAGENFDAMQASLSQLAKDIGSATGKEKDQLIAASGGIGDAIASTQAQAKGLSGSVSQKSLIDRFKLGDSPEVRRMLANAGVEDGIGATVGGKGGIDAAELVRKITGFKTSAKIAGDGKKDMAGAEGEDKLLGTLTKINTTLDKNTAALVLAANKFGSGITDEMKDKAIATLNETGAAKKP